VEECEQHTDAGLVRRRTVVLDVESQTDWDLKACDLLAEVLTGAHTDWPADEARQ